MTVGRTIDYEALSQDAMRGVVRTILVEVAKHGLPGDHHFYISFDTQAAGVLISKRLLEKYADEMTIVLQHRFWDLLVGTDHFEVKLTFDGIPERLVVPFTAIRVFFDPSVRYGLQFETVGDDQGQDDAPDAGGRALIVQLGPDQSRTPAAARKARARRKPRIEKIVAAEPGGESARRERDRAPVTGEAPRTVEPMRKPARGAAPDDLSRSPADTKSDAGTGPARRDGASEGPPAQPRPAAAAPPSGAQVVSLDAFRKK
jgi:hypothetical protein